MSALLTFGMHNRSQKFSLKMFIQASMRKIGANKNHLKLVFEDSSVSVDAVGFGLGYILDEVSPIAKVSLVGERIY